MIGMCTTSGTWVGVTRVVTLRGVRLIVVVSCGWWWWCGWWGVIRVLLGVVSRRDVGGGERKARGWHGIVRSII